jgi:hypothetical protein
MASTTGSIWGGERERDQVINGKNRNRKTKNYAREISINKMSN